MKDIPVFATENGVASLTLRQIPVKGDAYILMRSVSETEAFLKECVDFCRAAGAQKVYASGHDSLKVFSVHTEVWSMEAPVDILPQTEAYPAAVSEETLSKWRALYNSKMDRVAGAAWLSLGDARKILEENTGYFVYLEAELMGIGVVRGNVLDAVASVKRGMGAQVLSALCKRVDGKRVCLEVSSVNQPAISLYTRLGFAQTGVVSRWYTVY